MAGQGDQQVSGSKVHASCDGPEPWPSSLTSPIPDLLICRTERGVHVAGLTVVLIGGEEGGVRAQPGPSCRTAGISPSHRGLGPGASGTCVCDGRVSLGWALVL